MTFARDRAARFSRLAKGTNTTTSVGTSVVVVTLAPDAVAFNLSNYSNADMFLTSDGTAPTVDAGWPILSKQQTGWVECVGGLVLQVICGTAGSRLDVWQIQDEDPS